MADRRDALRARENPLGIDAMSIMNQAIGDATDEPQVVEREVVVYEADPNALRQATGGDLEFKRFRMTAVGLEWPEDTTGDELDELETYIRPLDKAMQWIIGDYLVARQRVRGETYDQVAARWGRKPKTLQNYVWVAGSVPISLRKEGLEFGHHNLVAGMDAEQQTAWLQWAVDNKSSVTQMHKAIQEWRGDNPPTPPALPETVVSGERDAARRWTQVRHYLSGKLHADPNRMAREARELAAWLEQFAQSVEG